MNCCRVPSPLSAALAAIIVSNLLLSTVLMYRRDDSTMIAPSASATAGPPVGIWSRWAEQPTQADLRDVYLYSQAEGWAVGGTDVSEREGDTPVILRYAAGLWSEVNELPHDTRRNVLLNAVDGTGPDNVWVAGQEYRRALSEQDLGLLLHYDGIAWQRVGLPVQSPVPPLMDIDVVPTEAGYEVWVISRADERNTSYIFRFDGMAWHQETIQNRSLLGIHMLSAREGQIVTMGAGGAPDGHHYWYHDGFWQATSVWTPQPLRAVSMAESTYGWAVGSRGATDEYVGQCHNSATDCRWNARQAVRSAAGVPIYTDLWDVQMVSPREGWLVGEPWARRSTIAYLTQESSPKWRIVPVEGDPGQPLYGLAMWAGSDGPAVEGWAVGADGTILHYTLPRAEPSATPTTTATASPTPSVTAPAVPTLSPTVSPSRWWVFLPLASRDTHPGDSPDQASQESKYGYDKTHNP